MTSNPGTIDFGTAMSILLRTLREVGDGDVIGESASAFTQSDLVEWINFRLVVLYYFGGDDGSRRSDAPAEYRSITPAYFSRILTVEPSRAQQDDLARAVGFRDAPEFRRLAAQADGRASPGSLDASALAAITDSSKRSLVAELSESDPDLAYRLLVRYSDEPLRDVDRFFAAVARLAWGIRAYRAYGEVIAERHWRDPRVEDAIRRAVGGAGAPEYPTGSALETLRALNRPHAPNDRASPRQRALADPDSVGRTIGELVDQLKTLVDAVDGLGQPTDPSLVDPVILQSSVSLLEAVSEDPSDIIAQDGAQNVVIAGTSVTWQIAMPAVVTLACGVPDAVVAAILADLRERQVERRGRSPAQWAEAKLLIEAIEAIRCEAFVDLVRAPKNGSGAHERDAFYGVLDDLWAAGSNAAERTLNTNHGRSLRINAELVRRVERGELALSAFGPDVQHVHFQFVDNQLPFIHGLLPSVAHLALVRGPRGATSDAAQASIIDARLVRSDIEDESAFVDAFVEAVMRDGLAAWLNANTVSLGLGSGLRGTYRTRCVIRARSLALSTMSYDTWFELSPANAKSGGVNTEALVVRLLKQLLRILMEKASDGSWEWYRCVIRDHAERRWLQRVVQIGAAQRWYGDAWAGPDSNDGPSGEDWIPRGIVDSDGHRFVDPKLAIALHFLRRFDGH